jgi:hypothetical protein
MLLRSGLAALAVTVFAIGQSAAQQNVTVQLPTFNATTVQTTVSVPDGGTGLLGGISRASEGSVTRGVPMLGKIPGASRLFKNRGIGRDVGLSQMTVTPRIIILEEEELRQTGFSYDTLSQLSPTPVVARALAVAEAGAIAPDPEVAGQADFLARNIARHPAPSSDIAQAPGLPSVEEIKRQNELAKARRSSEAGEFFAKGQRAEAEGKAGVARIWYEMAARRADGELQQEVAERLAILAGSTAREKLAGR